MRKGDKLFILGVILLSWVMGNVMKGITANEIAKRVSGDSNYIVEEMIHD